MDLTLDENFMQIPMTDEQLFEFCQINRDLRIERDRQGDLFIMLPTGGETGNRNAEITMQLRIWAKRDRTGTSFDSSTGFRLPNGAIRSPDASWIKNTRLALLSSEERKKFIPLCPDVVIELRSATDHLGLLDQKMQEYIDNGACLGWLIDPEEKRVYIYKPGLPVQIIEDPFVLNDPMLQGFTLDLREIW